MNGRAGDLTTHADIRGSQDQGCDIVRDHADSRGLRIRADGLHDRLVGDLQGARSCRCREQPASSPWHKAPNAGHRRPQSQLLAMVTTATEWHPILAVRLRHIHTVERLSLLLLCNKVHVHVHAKNRAFGSASALARQIGLILIPLKLPMNQIRYALLPGPEAKMLPSISHCHPGPLLPTFGTPSPAAREF